MRYLKLLTILIVMLLGAAFAVMNSTPVSFDYYFGVCDLPLSMILVGALFCGALLGAVTSIGTLLRLKREIRMLRRQERVSSEQVSGFRTLPLKE